MSFPENFTNPMAELAPGRIVSEKRSRKWLIAKITLQAPAQVSTVNGLLHKMGQPKKKKKKEK